MKSFLILGWLVWISSACADEIARVAVHRQDQTLMIENRLVRVVYDFWNDRLVGKVPGQKRFEQTLRPGEARMMSIHEVDPHPQFLATDRHLMQGYVDMLGCEWNAATRQLHGVSTVVGGEAYRVIIACNGKKSQQAVFDDTIPRSVATSRSGPAQSPTTVQLRTLPGDAGLAELTIVRADNGPVAWTITFEEP